MFGQAWWHTPVIPTVKRLKQENHEFQTSLGYKARPGLKKTMKKEGMRERRK
jgi:hypothetical protein